MLACCVTAALSSFGCERQKSVSEMTDEEKLALVMPGEEALTPLEQQRQHEVRREILNRVQASRASEAAMARALAEAEEVLKAEDFSVLELSQSRWLRQGRGHAINALISQGIEAGEAFSLATQQRADAIEEGMALVILISNPKTYQGFYRSSGGQSLAIYEMPVSRLNVVLRHDEASLILTATGTWSGDADVAEVASEREAAAALRVRRFGQNVLEVSLAPSFSESSLAALGAIFEARFERVLPGEIDVFAF
ncbi:MAG: hypothetical protein FWC40_04855 [Proteobacteria bacterium]|nr:hypothetical protein [Pseudomonadota bacterium]